MSGAASALTRAKSIKNGGLTVHGAVRDTLAKAEERNPQLNAYITVCAENAISAAESADRLIREGRALSPLAGVSVAVKDNICTRGVRTTCASRMLAEFTPVYSATAHARIESAGLITVGKANMDEFAMGSTCESSCFGGVKNPLDIERVPGGSSGGCAAAVAAGMADIALASDTGGSIRLPAAYCALTGFKPTYGSVSRYGLIAYASSFDQIGPIGKSAADCAALTDIIRGRDVLDCTTTDSHGSLLGEVLGKESLRGVRIALPKQCFEHSALAPDVRERVLAAAEVMKALGAQVAYVDVDIFDYLIPTYYIIATAQAASNLARYDGVKYGYRADDCADLSDMYKKTRGRGFGEEVKRRIMLGNFVLSGGYYEEYYMKALKARRVIADAYDALFGEYDLILTPTAPTTAPLQGAYPDPVAMYLTDIYTVPANLAGLPAVSFPCGNGADGMPVGAHVMGARGADGAVLACAHLCEGVLGS